MADTKTSALPDAGALAGTELVPIVQSGSNRKLSLSTLLTWITAALLTAKRLIPDGGTDGQYLRREGLDGDLGWSAPPEGLPAYSSTPDGYTLALVAGVPAWGLPPRARRRVVTAATPGSASLVHAGLSSVGEGTAGAVSPAASAPPVTAVVRLSFTTAASAGSSAGFRYTVAYLYRGADASCGGFYWRCVWSPQDAATVAQRRCFVGLTAATGAFGNVNPSSKTDIFGVGADSGDADLSIIHNDSTGAAAKITLTGFDQDDTEALYDALLWCLPGDSALRYRVTRHKAGGAPTILEGAVTSDIPAADTLLTHYVWVNNGSTALAAVVHFAVLEVERDV